MWRQLSPVIPTKFNCPDSNRETDRGDFLANYGLRIPARNRQINKVWIAIRKNSEPYVIAVMKWLTSNQ